MAIELSFTILRCSRLREHIAIVNNFLDRRNAGPLLSVVSNCSDCRTELSSSPFLRAHAQRSGTPKRPAWEYGQCFVFSNINAHGVDSGYEKRQQNKVPFRLVFEWRVFGGCRARAIRRSQFDDCAVGPGRMTHLQRPFKYGPSGV